MTKLLLAIVAVAAPAYADAKYTRKPILKIDVTLSDRVKASAPTPVPEPKPLTANDVMLVEDVTQPFRLEQEGILAKLVADTPDDDPDKPDLMFRLAEHYAKQQRFWRFKAIDPTMPKIPTAP